MTMVQFILIPTLFFIDVMPWVKLRPWVVAARADGDNVVGGV